MWMTRELPMRAIGLNDALLSLMGVIDTVPSCGKSLDPGAGHAAYRPVNDPAIDKGFHKPVKFVDVLCVDVGMFCASKHF
jgi:hypothetical protein